MGASAQCYADVRNIWAGDALSGCMTLHFDQPRAIPSLLAEIATLRAQVDQLQLLADTDPLTGLANRRVLERELFRTILLCGRRRSEAAVVLIDLDGFKQINDSHGHLIGDAALCHVAAHLRASFRESDHIGRLGGDEFLLILPDAKAADADKSLAAMATALWQMPVVAEAHPVRLSLSWGVACVQAGDAPAAVIARADAALYRAKAPRSELVDQRSDR
jgi:diguanylate cyclase (GGDEF)-like protein